MTYPTELARPFPPRYVKQNPSGGGSYVAHHIVTQRLIEVLGEPPGFEVVEVIRGNVAEIPPNPQGQSKRAREGAPELISVVVAVIGRMTAKGFAPIDEAGDCEEPHNWKTDGQRLKDAMSDAYKRAAMRLGCGLHLWSQDDYFLYDRLKASERESASSAGAESTRTAQEDAEPTDNPPPNTSPQGGVSAPAQINSMPGASSADGPQPARPANGRLDPSTGEDDGAPGVDSTDPQEALERARRAQQGTL